jgi:peptidoglycan hydrolase-like protein with peptidoglycan-binding domain
VKRSRVGFALLSVLCETGVLLANDVSEEGIESAADGVRLAAEWFSQPVRTAVRGAAHRLADPDCAALLDDFSDAEGRSLRQRLEQLGVDAPAYTRSVLFYDGSNELPCRRRRMLLAYTAPGFRFVRVCPRLAALAHADPREAEIIVIHEILHTLGLAENPPTHEEITARVFNRCGSNPANVAAASRRRVTPE